MSHLSFLLSMLEKTRPPQNTDTREFPIKSLQTKLLGGANTTTKKRNSYEKV